MSDNNDLDEAKELQKFNFHDYCTAALILTKKIAIDFKTGKHAPYEILYTEEASKIRSATVTFVKYNQSYYAITCAHVIKQVVQETNKDIDALTGDYPEHTENLKKSGEYDRQLVSVIDNFVTLNYEFKIPKPEIGTNQQPDIAIAKISSKDMKAIGKKAIPINKNIKSKIINPYSVAVGFPERKKYFIKKGKNHKQMVLPHALISAKFNSKSLPENSFYIQDTAEIDTFSDNDFSGMSGGPVFWVDENEFGLTGLFSDSADNGRFNKSDYLESKDIFYKAEYASPELLKSLIDRLF